VTLFTVVREAGPAWLDGGIFDQPAVSEHAAFMNTLAEDGLVVFGGPLGGTETGRVRVLLVAHAGSEAEIRSRLADDPWERADRIVTVSAEPWRILVGDERLPCVGTQNATTRGPSPGMPG
jgi:uncharacterized protein YciI